MSLRAAWRGLLLSLSLLVAAFYFGYLALLAILQFKKISTAQRAGWMHFCGKIVTQAIGFEILIEGKPPTNSSVIVSNHLSYLDIAITSAVFPSTFVAKQEIAAWPVFGALAKLGGTIFLDRESAFSACSAVDTMVAHLNDGVPVLFFPEGTSTDGEEVLKFHTTLFEAAVQTATAVTPLAITYFPHGDLLECQICWFGYEVFLPNLLRVLGAPGLTAVIRFGAPEHHPDRRCAALRSHDAVQILRSRFPSQRAGAAVDSRTTKLVETRNSR